MKEVCAFVVALLVIPGGGAAQGNPPFATARLVSGFQD